ncbi:hypothetical protein DF3PB_6350003 [uncultured Defluviicoccus sp.]|uniref:Uncharacterized protein n=1 Tax=metagenome TaxID=256318 RepID=A0A380TJJ8_9ZZZZ|nr:hypothetical protein DF3PB_6350003 [uncultured Defluviicoccus sp.]
MYSDLKSELMGWAAFRGSGERWLAFSVQYRRRLATDRPRLHLAGDLARILTLASKGGKPSRQAQKTNTLIVLWK